MNKKERERRETELAKKIIDGENTQENITELYELLTPLYKGIIYQFGSLTDKADLMQEMYFALLNALEYYKSVDRDNYVFPAVVFSYSRNAVSAYGNRFYRQYRGDDGKMHTHTSHMGAVSLNKRVGEETGAQELQYFIPAETTIEEELIQRENANEQQNAAIALWGEVDTLPQHYREAVIDCYKNGLNYKERAEKAGITYNVSKNRLARGLKVLRNNENVQRLTQYYIPNFDYCVRTKDREGKEAARSSYILKDPSIMNGVRLAIMARYTGLSITTLQQLRNQEGILRSSAQFIANYWKKPFDELFKIYREAPPKKPRPAYKPQPSSCFKLVRSDILDGYKRKEIIAKMENISVHISTIESCIKLLKSGGKTQKKSAERLATIFEKPFDELFEVA